MIKKENWFHQYFGWLIVEKSNTGSLNPDANPIDIQLIAKNIDLEANARQSAEKNLPHPSYLEPFGLEHTILGEVHAKRAEHINYYVNLTKSLDNEILNYSFMDKIHEARRMPEVFQNKAIFLIDKNNHELDCYRKTLQKEEIYLEKFKEQNNLDRAAKISSSLWTSIKFLFIALLIVIESIANASFFASGLDGGLFAGALVALMCAVVNVMVPFLVGYTEWGFKNIFHIKNIRKIWGWIVFAFMLSWMIVISLGIGHLRDSLNSGSNEAPVLALQSFGAAPFILKDLFSYLLFLVSLVCASVAFIDGLFFKDLYPGFSKIYASAKSAQEKLEEALRDLDEQINQLKENVLKDLEQSVDKTKTDLIRLKELIYDKKKAGDQMHVHMTNAQNAVNALLSQYRKFLAEYRKDEAYLPERDFLQLQEPVLPNFDISPNQKAFDTKNNAYQKLEMELTSIEGEIKKLDPRTRNHVIDLTSEISSKIKNDKVIHG